MLLASSEHAECFEKQRKLEKAPDSKNRARPAGQVEQKLGCNELLPNCVGFE